MQPVPEGYEPLNFVGFTDRGTYSDSMTYIKNDITHKDNTAWRCLIDDTVGITPSPDNKHWEVFVAATNDSSGITTTDILGILGNEGEKVSNQDLIDAIADRVINKLVEKAQMSGVQVNDENRIPTSALLYRMNNEISESLDELNGNISSHKSSGDHDGRYYTEAEVNNLLAGKAAASHNHAWPAITGTPSTFPPSSHGHAWGEITGKPSAYTPVAHTHDDRYFTESEIKNMIWNEIAVEEFSVDNVSLEPGPHTREFDISKAGYWIAGIVHADVMNATSGGMLSSKCPVYGFGTYGQSTGFIRIRCLEAAKVKITIKVLYWKDPR